LTIFRELDQGLFIALALYCGPKLYKILLKYPFKIFVYQYVVIVSGVYVFIDSIINLYDICD
jgi:hypothetical protein